MTGKNTGAKNKYDSLKENAFTDVFPVERDNMAMNINTTEADDLLAKQHIWEKFASRLQEWRESESSTTSLNPSDMNPDVIVIPKNNTILFEPRTPQAALWLRTRYRLTPETVENNTAIMVHPYQQKQLTAELKAAGFAVAE